MRGKPDKIVSRKRQIGITPADAGKTIISVRVHTHLQDHPRGCGENVCLLRRHCCQRGSPPRMRGKLQWAGTPNLHGRITPADAGKTYDLRKNVAKFEDHPRGCGENAKRLSDGEPHPGSPPRMRGKRFGFGRSQRAGGITPADAGKTL